MKFARLTRATATVALVCAATLGCSSDDEPAEAASVEEQYCQAYRDFFDERASQDMETSDAEVVATLKSWGERLEEIGPPDAMPADAKSGHEIWTDLIAEVDDDANQADVVALESDLTEKQMAQVEEFFAFNDASCLGSGGSSPSAP